MSNYHEIINLGGNNPHELIEIINLIEKYTGKKAKLVNKEFHKADIKLLGLILLKRKKF